MIVNPDVCVFHSPCIDGHSSAFFVWLKYKDCTFHPGKYNEELPENLINSSANILLVDFSYKFDYIVELSKRVASITILDHHKSFYKEIKDKHIPSNVFITYNPNHCGATLTYHSLEIGKQHKLPSLLKYVRDRDLWLKEYEETDIVHAYLTTLPLVFEDWFDTFYSTEFEDILIGGHAVLRSHQKIIQDILPNTKEINFAGYKIPCVNIPSIFASEALNTLCQNKPFALGYYIAGDNAMISLRSAKNNPESIDVSKIAELFNGGGHENSAGCKLPLSEFIASYL
jgi:hypothetical protein